MMLRIRKAMAQKEQGFTLIELLVVIIIIGILAAIAIPIFLNQRKKGVDASMKSDAKNAATAAESFATDKPTDANFGATDAAIQQALTDNGFKLSPGNSLKVTGGPATGYQICIKNGGSSKGTAQGILYDSNDGGLKGFSTTGACAPAVP